jgi:hypothetical protein
MGIFPQPQKCRFYRNSGPLWGQKVVKNDYEPDGGTSEWDSGVGFPKKTGVFSSSPIRNGFCQKTIQFFNRHPKLMPALSTKLHLKTSEEFSDIQIFILSRNLKNLSNPEHLQKFIRNVPLFLLVFSEISGNCRILEAKSEFWMGFLGSDLRRKLSRFWEILAARTLLGL